MKYFNRLLAALCVALISVPAYAGRNGSGTYTAPSNSWNPVVTGTTIDSSDFNDLLDDIEAAMTASVAKDGQTTMTARIPFASGVSSSLGSTSSVAYGFIGDLNTGVYSSAADKLGLVTGGTEQIRIESALIHGVTNNTVDVGSSSVKFKDGYFAGTLTTGPITGTGLVTIGNGATSAGQIKILEDTDDGSNYQTITSPAISANIDYTLPSDDGAANEILSTDGSGALDWIKIGSSNVASTIITGQTDATIATGDTIVFSDASDSGNLKEDDIQGILDLVPAATATSVSQTAAQSLSNGWNALTFDTEVYDDGSWHSTVSNTSRITVGATGRYNVSGCYATADVNNGDVGIAIAVNGTRVRKTILDTGGPPEGKAICITFIGMSLSATNYVEIHAYHSSGADDTDTALTFFTVQKI